MQSKKKEFQIQMLLYTSCKQCLLYIQGEDIEGVAKDIAIQAIVIS